jgi:hypothetical protein
MTTPTKVCIASVVATALTGCGRSTCRSAAAELTAFGEYEGVWLRSDVAEAFVAVKPFPRVLVFQQTGGPNLLATHRRSLEGVRTWFMEPTQCKLSSRPARQPACVVALSPLHVEVDADAAAEAELRTGMHVTLASDRPELTIRHFMENLSEAPRELAVWSIVAFPQAGHAVIPFATDGPTDKPAKTYRTIVLFEGTQPDDPAFSYSDDELTIDFGQPRTEATKIGVCTNAGWAAWVGERTALRMDIDHDPVARYPEGGANVTAYLSGGPADRAWCELEHVGPLQIVEPGRRAWLTDRFTILPAEAAPK